MYLDNIIASAKTASIPQISYSEIMEDTLHMVEVEGAGELALLKAEATMQILGTEAPAEWWAKIQAVARKIFEMLKNLITKVFAFIKTIPDRVVTLVNRIAAKIISGGFENKVKTINEKKSDYEITPETLKSLKEREFKHFWTDEVVSGHSSDKGKAVKTAKEALDAEIKSAADEIAKLTKKDNSSYAEQVQAIKEKVIEKKNELADAEKTANDNPYKPFESDYNTVGKITALATTVVNFFKNKTYATKAKSLATANEQATRTAASTYRTKMAAYERHVREKNEEEVKADLAAAKALRELIASNAASASKTLRYITSDVLTAARIASAGLSAIRKKGAPAGGGEGTPAGTPAS